MCSICGFINFKDNYIKNAPLSDRLAHEMGAYGENGICIGEHAVFVCSPEVLPPIRRTVAGYEFTVMFCGKLYNGDVIKKELMRCGYEFSGNLDTEIILYSYIHYGRFCAEKLSGHFCIAVWDAMRQCVFICTDSLGITPLFYTETNGITVFSTDIHSLFKFPGLKPKMDKNGLCALFSAMRLPGESLFCGVKLLKPSHCLIVNRKETKTMNFRPDAAMLEQEPLHSVFMPEDINPLLKSAVRDTLGLEEYSHLYRERSIYELPHIEAAVNKLYEIIADNNAPVSAFFDMDKVRELVDNRQTASWQLIYHLLLINSFLESYDIRII